MGDKALNPSTLELTQKIQLHFPRNIDLAVERFWNGQPKEVITATLLETFGRIPAERVPQPQPILQFVSTFTLPPRSARFIVKDVFVAKKPGARVKFGYIDPDFTNAFGEMVEEPSAEVILRNDVLSRLSAFAPAIEELRTGGVITQTTPGELLSLLELQSKGLASKAGPLLADGGANLFEMVAKDGASRLVDVRWGAGVVLGGWLVCALPFARAGEWSAGDRVFSRGSRGPLAA